jgi:hypothetical protein
MTCVRFRIILEMFSATTDISVQVVYGLILWRLLRLCTNIPSMSETGPGRPKHADPPTTVTFRVPASLVRSLDAWAAARGFSRNQAGAALLQSGLAPPAGGYDPLTGAFR